MSSVEQSVKPKMSMWAKVTRYLFGMSDGTILHGEEIESVPDLQKLGKKAGTRRKSCFRC